MVDKEVSGYLLTTSSSLSMVADIFIVNGLLSCGLVDRPFVVGLLHSVTDGRRDATLNSLPGPL